MSLHDRHAVWFKGRAEELGSEGDFLGSKKASQSWEIFKSETFGVHGRKAFQKQEDFRIKRATDEFEVGMQEASSGARADSLRRTALEAGLDPFSVELLYDNALIRLDYEQQSEIMKDSGMPHENALVLKGAIESGVGVYEKMDDNMRKTLLTTLKASRVYRS